jgi:hypothetical protein
MCMTVRVMRTEKVKLRTATHANFIRHVHAREIALTYRRAHGGVSRRFSLDVRREMGAEFHRTIPHGPLRSKAMSNYFVRTAPQASHMDLDLAMVPVLDLATGGAQAATLRASAAAGSP